jgi:putative oxidoreductase
MILKALGKYREGGLLVLRVGLGISYILHGAPKIMGGPEKWEKLGGAMQSLGISFAPEFWGFMASATEFFGALLLISGLLFREAALFLFITMFVAATNHLVQGDGFRVASHAIENGIVFFSLMFIGPGRYSVDERMGWNK